MKKLLITILVFTLSSLCLYAQPAYKLTLALDSVNSNAVSALFAADGFLSFTPPGYPDYRVPKGGKACTIFCGALWIGGIDAGGLLHTAAATYRQNGADFWPGPIMDSTDYSAHGDTVWNHLYKVDKSTIDSFKKGLFGTKIPASILNWPGNGDVSKGEMAKLAPYVDSSKSGYYNPVKGDYPLIRGDEAMFMIYNDARVSTHTESGGLKFGVEVHLMVYQFNSTDSAVNQTTFMHYDIFNRSKNTYDSVYIANWVDMDIGNGGDDYLGCDSANNFWYTFNGEATDPNGTGNFYGEVGYHYAPPAEGVVYMCDTMTHFQYYSNVITLYGNPSTPKAYYGYMKSLWGDSTHVKYFDTTTTNSNYMFSGNPVTGAGWTMSKHNPFGDVRGLSSIGPFTFKAGDSRSIDLALIFAQGDSLDPLPNISSVALLQKYVPDVRNFYNTQSYGCDSSLLAINEVISNNEEVKVYPNPSTGLFTFSFSHPVPSTRDQGSHLTVYNELGEIIFDEALRQAQGDYQINLGNESPGIYFYRIISEKGEVIGSGKLVIQ